MTYSETATSAVWRAVKVTRRLAVITSFRAAGSLLLVSE